MICFQISIFEPLKTVSSILLQIKSVLWFAFKLVSLNHWKQSPKYAPETVAVVICFQISIFEPLKTVRSGKGIKEPMLWFAFKLVSLNHWKQCHHKIYETRPVVICFQISIFEPLKTVRKNPMFGKKRCDLLSN